MDTDGTPSSSTMVPTPLTDVPTTALTGAASATTTVSSTSSSASPVTGTSNVRAVVPGAKVKLSAATAV